MMYRVTVRAQELEAIRGSSPDPADLHLAIGTAYHRSDRIDVVDLQDAGLLVVPAPGAHAP
jgi:hypothetical protein